MNELFLVRLIGYTLLPLLMAAAHIRLDRQASTITRRIELVTMYLLAISVGANGLGGAFGHLFLSDLVAEGIGWPTGSPFQLEMGFANLAMGILGIMAISRLDGFRTATIVAVSVIGFGATGVHIVDMIAHGNLAPGNTIQNFANLTDPILLMALAWWSSRLATTDADIAAFTLWQQRQQPIAGMAAAGIGIGFGIGYAMSSVLILTLLGGLVGASIGIAIRHNNGPQLQANRAYVNKV